MKEKYHTLIIGSGAAGYNAADWLHNLGVTDIAIVTEGVNMGTSRNTGSDKQTYYKLALAGEGADSVAEMAQTLFGGGSVHGDTAMVEAACSATAFMKLVHLGVPFPTNQYGAFVGYQTDHDTAKRQRATSCGPLTSKLMTEALQNAVAAKGVEVLDGCTVVKLLTTDEAAGQLPPHSESLCDSRLGANCPAALQTSVGANCVRPSVAGLILLDAAGNYHTLYCQNIILATGGPAAVYADVVFPQSQTGGTGLALAAGAAACNLQEWQYGLASTDFRWNVSGTYQQVLPRYISIDENGNEHEFLLDYFSTPAQALDMVFLKGYQWPFDAAKIDGSSKIDQLVAIETNEKGRKVYMDYRQNPIGLDFSQLAPETFDYLKNSDALFGTPIERLAKMNPKAIKLYADNGIDLYTQPLRIAVCAQHCNGGIAVDTNWQSTVQGLYVVGEAAGTFGAYRPGGSALNATQVGSMRAAQHIAGKPVGTKVVPTDFHHCEPSSNRHCGYNRNDTAALMSRYAAYTRNTAEMESLYARLCQIRDNFTPQPTVDSHKTYDTLITQIAILSAMIFSAKEIGSRGGAIVDGKSVDPHAASFNNRVITTTAEGSFFEPVRPLPQCNDWFENVWNA